MHVPFCSVWPLLNNEGKGLSSATFTRSAFTARIYTHTEREREREIRNANEENYAIFASSLELPSRPFSLSRGFFRFSLFRCERSLR